jgi:hypothetical protein
MNFEVRGDAILAHRIGWSYDEILFLLNLFAVPKAYLVLKSE